MMRLKYTFETMELGDQIVVIPVGDGASNFHGVIKVNEVGAKILKYLSEDLSEDVIIERLIEEYDAPLEVLQESVRCFLSSFEEKGMLTE